MYFFFLKGISPQTEDSVPEPVAAATDGILATDASAVPATGSARHSRHSSEMSPTKDSDHDNGDHDDTDLAYRPRPPISEDLFQMPVTPEPQDSTEINPGAYIHVHWSFLICTPNCLYMYNHVCHVTLVTSINKTLYYNYAHIFLMKYRFK